jgi:hypothetical protein
VTDFLLKGSRATQAIDFNEIFMPLHAISRCNRWVHGEVRANAWKSVCRQDFGSEAVRPSSLTGVD